MNREVRSLNIRRVLDPEDRSNARRFHFENPDIALGKFRYSYPDYLGPNFLEEFFEARNKVFGLRNVSLANIGSKLETTRPRAERELLWGENLDALGEVDYPTLLQKALPRYERRRDLTFAGVENMISADSPPSHWMWSMFLKGFLESGDVRFLNAGLKLGDQITSRVRLKMDTQSPFAASAAEMEIEAFAVFRELFIPRLSDLRKNSSSKLNKPVPMSLPRTKLALAVVDGLRARVYVNELSQSGLNIAAIYLGGPCNCGQSYPSIEHDADTDLTGVAEIECICVLAERFQIPVVRGPGSLNSGDAHRLINELDFDFLIFSGQTGEILSDETLARLGPIHHAHPGRLPEYRGSTTLYWELLHGLNPSVSVIQMERKIDAGPTLGHFEFNLPARAIELDYDFEPWIRARAFVNYLSVDGHALEKQSRAEDSAPGLGRMYYVIHPLLRNEVRMTFGNDE